MKKITIARLFGLSTFCLVGVVYAQDVLENTITDKQKNAQTIQSTEVPIVSLPGEAKSAETKSGAADVDVVAPKITEEKTAVKATRAVIKEARRLNTLAFRLYRKGKFDEALPLFKRAIDENTDYMLAQYNFACTATLILEKPRCETLDDLAELVTPDSIINALKITVTLDPERISRIKTDPDLAVIRSSFRYFKEILGYSLSDMDQLKEMLVTIPWEGGNRFYHAEPEIRLNFDTNGNVMLKQAHIIEAPKDDKLWTHTKKEGTYVVSEGVITLTFGEGDKQQIFTGNLNDKGILHLDSSDADTLPANDLHFQWPTPCEA